MMHDELDPPSIATAVDAAQRPALERLRAGWHARLRPVDAAERAVVDAMVAQTWRAGRLDALEERVLTALLEGGETAGLPSLATLLRCRGRLERDRKAAEAELQALRAARPERAPADAPEARPAPADRPAAAADAAAPGRDRPAEPPPAEGQDETGAALAAWLEAATARWAGCGAIPAEPVAPIDRELQELLAREAAAALEPERPRLAAAG